MKFKALINVLQKCDVEIADLHYEVDSLLYNSVDIVIKIQGTFLEITEKIKKLMKELEPLLNEDVKFYTRFLDIDGGGFDLEKGSGYMWITIKMKGMNVEIGE